MEHRLEVITVAEMAEADRKAATTGTPGAILMDRAGRAVADAAAAMLEAGGGRGALVLCGPGNNGGDGFVAAADLARRGFAVEVAALSPVDALRGDARAAAARWHGSVGDAWTADLEGRGVVVDALFGAGLSRPLEGKARAAVDRLNASGRPVLSVDLPSGLAGDSGQALGAAVRAKRTVTFFRLKPGHLLMPGRALCGSTTLADIGIDRAVLGDLRPRLWQNRPALWEAAFPWPSPEGHKYTRGHLVAVSGPMPTLGAARLSAHGALRAGAGLVTVASPPDAVAAHAAQLTAVMLRPFDGAAGLAEMLSDARMNAVVLGPGLGHGPGAGDLVATALRASGGRRAAVLDADALTLFAGRAGDLARLVGGDASRPVVATPHDGEFAKLFAGDDGVLRAGSKIERARAGALRLGAVLVLKGPDTVVAAPDGRAAVSGEDAPWLATAGSGDVLSGFVGGLLAQGMPPFEAACAAVWLHAAAADHFGPGLTSEDLPDALPPVLRALRAAAPAR